MLLDQQLQLHFGDTYPNVVSQATRFCKTVVGKPWWGQNRSVLLHNEGGMSGMRRQALIRIIEKGEVEPGLKDYGSYLRLEYGSDKLLPSLDDIEVSSTIESEVVSRLVGDADFDPAEGTQSLYDLLQEILPILQLTVEEKKFFTTYSSVQDVAETCALLALDETEGWKTYKRVKERARYQLALHADRDYIS